MNKISVVIITKNEEKNIKRCLQSVKWADETVVLDTNSEDKTLELAEKEGAAVYSQNEWKGFGKAKKEAVSLASFDWIFSIDADEEVTHGLKKEIEEVLKEPQKNVYKVKRNSFYLGKMIKYCGWDKDHPLRLFNRKYAGFNEKLVHESVETNEKPGFISSPLLHYTYPELSLHIEKINRYTDLAVQEDPKRKISLAGAFAGSIFFFVKMYFLKKGFLDGKEGFILSVMSSYGNLIKYLKFWHKNK